jgi:hypothetical protein
MEEAKWERHHEISTRLPKDALLRMIQGISQRLSRPAVVTYSLCPKHHGKRGGSAQQTPIQVLSVLPFGPQHS